MNSGKGEVNQEPEVSSRSDWGSVLVSLAMGQSRQELLWEGNVEAEIPEDLQRVEFRGQEEEEELGLAGKSGVEPVRSRPRRGC